MTTDVNGQASFTGLPVGLYYVKEVSAPAGYTMAAPFLVTLPMTDTNGPDNIAGNADDNTTWMYDVYVYPKNQQDSITKTVDDKGTQTTDNANGPAADHVIDYTLTSTITDGTTPLGMYVIYDDLDPALTFTGADVSLGGTALTPGTDYIVYTAPDWTTPATKFTAGSTVAGGPAITIVMTDAGLAKLEANRTAEVSTVLHTTVGAMDADGIVPNKGSFIPNESWWKQNGTNPGTVNPETPDVTPPGEEPGIPSNEVLTKYGNLQITKFDGGAPTTMLANAEFTVYVDANNDEKCTADDVTAANVIGGPVVTGTNGIATFVGLQTSDFYNNATQTDLITYCVVETKAPAGYNLNADPIKFTISQTTDGTVALATLDVANEKTNLNNNLPLTGGEGVAMVSGLGLLLVGGGFAYYMVNRRKETRA